MNQKKNLKLPTIIFNEKLKLRATFYNNLAVAWAATGVVIPYIGYFHNDLSILGMFTGETTLHSPEGRLLLGYAFGMAAAVCFAFLFRFFANRELAKLS